MSSMLIDYIKVLLIFHKPIGIKYNPYYLVFFSSFI